MAVILGIQTINNVLIISTDVNPTLTGGVDAPIGSLVLASDGSGNFYKTNTGLTDWRTISVDDTTLLFTDNTTNNVSTSKHGYAPKLPNDATQFLNGTGTYSVPAGLTSATSNLFAYYNFI